MRCSSLSDAMLSLAVLPSRRTAQLRGSEVEAPGRNTLNKCPQFVHLTVVPRAATRVSSNSYSVPQRSHVTSIGSSRARDGSALWVRVDETAIDPRLPGLGAHELRREGARAVQSDARLDHDRD